MRYVAVAAGFDGTLAQNGRVDERCIDALRALAASGRKAILVTARELRGLLEIFPEARIFDYVIAENGAVMYRSATRQSEILAQAPPEILLQELRRRHVTPLSVGSSIVTTAHEHEREISDALRKLQLDFQLVTNPGALMMLPAGVNKASGVKAALREMGVSRHNLVAIGDGENDLALFELAGQAVAVQNADPLVKRVADRTTQGAYCEGFLELAHELISNDLAGAVPRRRILLGLGEHRQEVSFVPSRDSLLVHGPPNSGKGIICNRLLEQLLAEGYQCCMIGAHLASSYPTPADMKLFGASHDVPRLTDILSAIEQPTTSVIVNLAGLTVEARPVFADALLLQLQALHDRVGRPHAVFIHQAHAFLAGQAALTALQRLSQVSMIYATSEPDRLPPQVLGSVQLIVDSATQAIAAGGVVGRMSAFRPVSAGKDALSSPDAATASGY